MHKALYIGLVSAAFAATGFVSIAHANDTNTTSTGHHVRNGIDRTGSAVGNAARGTGHAIVSGANGVAYGTREVGQTISGRQGNPRGEMRSSEENARMHQQGAESGSDFREAGRDVTGRSKVRGGGPVIREDNVRDTTVRDNHGNKTPTSERIHVRSGKDNGTSERSGEHAGWTSRNANEPRSNDQHKGFHPFRATGHAIQAGGEGVALGARELGQSVTGRQGDRREETRSAHLRSRMDSHANESRAQFGLGHNDNDNRR